MAYRIPHLTPSRKLALVSILLAAIAAVAAEVAFTESPSKDAQIGQLGPDAIEERLQVRTSNQSESTLGD